MHKGIRILRTAHATGQVKGERSLRPTRKQRTRLGFGLYGTVNGFIYAQDIARFPIDIISAQAIADHLRFGVGAIGIYCHAEGRNSLFYGAHRGFYFLGAGGQGYSGRNIGRKLK